MQTEAELARVDKSIFRAYDIRGVVGKELNETSVYLIGKAIGSQALQIGEHSVAVARDGRLSGPMLMRALREGIMASGCHVIDVGMVPTPVLYYATTVLETRSGVMLTGSHNPANYNGLKIVMNGAAYAGADILRLYQSIEDNQLLKGSGKLYEVDVLSRYIDEIKSTVSLAKKLKVVVDCGNGIPGLVAPELFRELGCEVEKLFCDVDGNFPHHHPDPSQPENLYDLIQKVQETQADLGLAFDGDGDRLGVVTNKGNIIWADRQLMLFAKDILARHPGGKIIYDVKCTNHLATVVRACGGEPIMWKTGHSLIKAKLAETDALLAGEMSGHIFFKDRWYGFDDALYAGARLLEILARTEEDIDTVFSAIPDSINTPELKIPVSEHEKFPLMEKIIANAQFEQADDINTIDGLRVSFASGWGLVRPSNTTPCLVLRFEAETQLALDHIKQLFKNFLLALEPKLDVPF